MTHLREPDAGDALRLIFLVLLVFACLLFPPLIVVALIFFGLWSRYDEWRERQRTERLGRVRD